MRKFIFYFEIGRNKENILQTVEVVVYANTPIEARIKASKRIVEDYSIETIQDVAITEVLR